MKLKCFGPVLSEANGLGLAWVAKLKDKNKSVIQRTNLVLCELFESGNRA